MLPLLRIASLLQPSLMMASPCIQPLYPNLPLSLLYESKASPTLLLTTRTLILAEWTFLQILLQCHPHLPLFKLCTRLDDLVVTLELHIGLKRTGEIKCLKKTLNGRVIEGCKQELLQ
jgi:hypothetical protein